MVFSYYHRLNRTQQRIYRQSDRITSIALPKGKSLKPLVKNLSRALESDNKEKTEIACRKLLFELTGLLDVPPVRIEVMAVRPSKRWGELHGLYYEKDGRKQPRIVVWMRTAQKKKVVAFRTFLRTVLHELGHHLDYELLNLADSFHTQGFYKRESSLLHQIADRG